MKRKFVQIVSISLIPALLAALAAGTLFALSSHSAASGASSLGSRIMRIGIYYGDAGKSSVSLTLTTGDGFEFGTYNEVGVFTPLPGASSAAVRAVTVLADPNSNFGIVVRDPSGVELFRHDDRGLGSGLAVRPYSLQGQKTVTKCGYPYYGGFRFERFTGSNDRMTVVNYISLDDYLKGVVPYEASPSWPIEALKAQAVCARTYALSRINAVHQSAYHFDLCDSVHCQAYKGVYSGGQASAVDEAVNATSGVTVRYNGEYCETLYSSSNGGASESNVNVNGKDYPYLIGKLDPYEGMIAGSIPNYNWTKTFTGAELRTKLIADGYTGCGRITGLKTSLSATGNVIALTFLDEYGKSYTIYRNRCRTFLSLRSLRYSVSSENGSTTAPAAAGSGTAGFVDSYGNALDFSRGVTVINGGGAVSTVNGGYAITANGVEAVSAATTSSSGGSSSASGTVFTFKGTGWGHNVGLSQYGAYSMAQLGYGYKEILEFYYTGVTVS